MVVAGSDVRHYGTEGIERCAVALLYLAVHVLLDLVHGHMSGALDEGLHVLGPGPFHQFSHGVEFRELCTVVGVVYTSGAQSVAERERHVIFCADVADVVEMLVQEALLPMLLAPHGDDAASAAHHSGKAPVRKVYVLEAYAAVYREVVHALLALLYQGVAEELPAQVFGLAVHLLHSLVHGYRAHWYGAVADYPLAGLVYVLAGGEVHKRIPSPLAAPHGLLHLLVYAGGGGGIAYVGVYLHEEVAAYYHGLGLGVVDVGGDYRPSCGHLVAHELGRYVRLYAQLGAVHVLAYRHILHFGSHYALPGVVHLAYLAPLLRPQRKGNVLEAQVVERAVVTAHASVFRRYLLQPLDASAPEYPRLAQPGKAFPEVYVDRGIAVWPAGVVDIDRGVRVLLAHPVLHRHGRHLVHEAHADPDVGMYAAFEVYLLRLGISYSDLVVHISL